MEKYSYLKLCSPDRLAFEVSQSAIITALDHIETATGTDVFMKAELSVNDLAILDAIITAHVATPLPDNEVKTVSVNLLPAFASKNFGTKKLFKRVIGISHSLSVGSNDVVWASPYPWAKMTGIEIIGGEIGDTVSLYILDSATGFVSQVPNLVLNQFGFAVNVSKDYYAHRSEFDADIYFGLQVKFVYNSVSAKNIGFNFILNEVK